VDYWRDRASISDSFLRLAVHCQSAMPGKVSKKQTLTGKVKMITSYGGHFG
jgi:hypothetical protein